MTKQTSDVKSTGHTITQTHSDGSSATYKIRIDEDSVWIEKGEQWITIPFDLVEHVIDAISDLMGESK